MELPITESNAPFIRVRRSYQLDQLLSRLDIDITVVEIHYGFFNDTVKIFVNDKNSFSQFMR